MGQDGLALLSVNIHPERRLLVPPTGAGIKLILIFNI